MPDPICAGSVRAACPAVGCTSCVGSPSGVVVARGALRHADRARRALETGARHVDLIALRSTLRHLLGELVTCLKTDQRPFVGRGAVGSSWRRDGRMLPSGRPRGVRGRGLRGCPRQGRGLEFWDGVLCRSTGWDGRRTCVGAGQYGAVRDEGRLAHGQTVVAGGGGSCVGDGD